MTSSQCLNPHIVLENFSGFRDSKFSIFNTDLTPNHFIDSKNINLFGTSSITIHF